MDTTFARRVNAWVSSLIVSRDVWRGSVRDCVPLCRPTDWLQAVWCERWLLGQRCLYVSSDRTSMSACFVTQDSDVCTFLHTGHGVKHKPG